MALEDLTGSDKFIDDLVESNPVGGADTWSTLDNHIRGIKNVLKNTFPNITAAITKTAAQINDLLEKAGGTMTGALNMNGQELQNSLLVNAREKVVTIAESTSAYEINLASAAVFDITLTANCSFTFTGWPASGMGHVTVYLRQDETGGRVPSWPSSVKFPAGYTPPIGANAGDLTTMQFYSINAGTAIQGYLGGVFPA